MNKIAEISKHTSILNTEIGCFAVSTGYSGSELQALVSGDGSSWESLPTYAAGRKIVSYGINNELPSVVRQIMDENSLAPGILEREIGLLYGDGPQVYVNTFSDTQTITREWQKAPEVWKWLDSWDFRRYVQMSMVEYKYVKGIFVKYFTTKGQRVGKGKIAKLEVIPSVFARLGYVDSRRLEDVKYIHEADWDSGGYGGVKDYKYFNKHKPFASPVAAAYHNSYSFARNFYSLPSYYGTLKWIMRSSDIPEIIKYLTDNCISVAYHIHSPSGYWDDLTDKVREAYPDKDSAFHDMELKKRKNEIFTSMSEVLAGKKNVGKFIETVDFPDPVSGDIVSWKIEPIDQKIKDFISTQISVSDKSDSATTSGMGLHPSLSNIIIGGQLSSGSQMLYALKLYLASDVSIAEEVIFEAINNALAINFPGRDYRMGFYRNVVKTEDEVSPEKRVKNVI